MKKHKKPWQMWLSLLGFMILMGDTSMRIKVPSMSDNEYLDSLGLWGKACGNFFVLVIPSIFVPLALTYVFARIFFPDVAEGSIEYELVAGVRLLFMYIAGVYATYRHSVWREKNISHLLEKKIDGVDDDSVG